MFHRSVRSMNSIGIKSTASSRIAIGKRQTHRLVLTTHLSSRHSLSANTPYTRTSVMASATQTDDVSPLRAALTNAVSGMMKLSGNLSPPEPGLSPLWQSIKRIDSDGVQAAVASGADLNERDGLGDTPLLFIARQGHYKYRPAEIPSILIKGGADMEAVDQKGLTPLNVSLLAGWQNISELLIGAGASTQGVAAIKGRITCPDCKRVVAKYNL